MKKQLIVISALTGVMTVALTLVIGRANNMNFALGQGNSHSHEIYLYGDSVTPDAYDEEIWGQPFSIHKDNAIVVSPTEKYPIASYDYDDGVGTYYLGEEEDITWNTPNSDPSKPNNIASMFSNWNSITIIFGFISWANFDTSNSLVYASDGDHFFEYYGEDEERVYYSTMIDGYSSYGTTIDIEYVKLVFSC